MLYSVSDLWWLAVVHLDNFMKTSSVARIHSFFDASKTKRYLVTLLVLVSFFVVSWATAGTLFGSRGSLSGDDWYYLTNIAYGQFPACTAGNSINPWRPLQPTAYCLLYQVVGLNLPPLYMVTVLVYTLLAYAWYGITRNVFRLSRWVAFAIGLTFLVYPDDLFRLSLIEGMRIVGPMATLYGIWAVLAHWDKPGEIWRLVAGCLLALYGLLTYETLIAAWALGLPLALLYKGGRWSRRWLRTTLVVELVAIGYFTWRYLILPTTYTEQTLIAGEHVLSLSGGILLGRARDSFLYTIGLWEKSFHWLDFYHTQNPAANVFAIVGIGLVIGLVTLLALAIVCRLDRIQAKDTPVRWLNLLIAMFVLVVIMALPFYLIDVDWMADTYHSFGSPFAASVGLVGLLWLILRKRQLAVPTITVIVTVMVVFSTVFAGYSTAEWQRETSYACDFFVRFTDVVQRLPQNVYVIVTARSGHLLPDYFDDAYRLTSYHALHYFEGPYMPDSYDFGRMGHMGYLMVADSFAELTPDGVKVSWPSIVTDLLHSRSPVPSLAPLDHTILVKYDPYRELTILSMPAALDGLVVRPEGGATSQASTLARHLCGWDKATSATIQHMDQVKQSGATAAVICSNEDAIIYKVDGDKRSKAFEVSKDELSKFPQYPATNILIAEHDNIRLYRLSSGELQINAPAEKPGQGDYVYIWTGCSK